MIIYYLFFILLLGLAVTEQVFKKIPYLFAVPIILLLVVLAGFRGEEVSRDYANYVEMYQFIGSFPDYFTFYDFYFIYEPLFYFIVSGLKTIFGSVYVPVFLLFALIGVSLKSAAIRKLSPYPFLSLLLYFVSFFFLHDMTQIRIGVAGGILLLYALPRLLNNNKKGFIGFCLLAGVIHYSSLLYIVLMFVKKSSINKWKYLAVFIFCFSISLLRIDFMTVISRLPMGAISMKLDNYNNTLEFTDTVRVNIFNVMFLIKMALGLALLALAGRHGDEKEILLTKIYFISLCSFLFFTGTAMLAFRVSELFGLIEFIALVYLVKRARFKFVAFGFLLIFACLYFILALFIEKNIQEYYLAIW